MKWTLVSGSELSQVEMIAKTVADLDVNSIVLTSTHNTQISTAFLERVRLNVIKGQQIYAPMAFWQYDPKLLSLKTKPSNTVDIARANGHFGDRWFEHLAFHVSDFTQARKASYKPFDNVYSLLQEIPGLSVFRSPDADCIVRHNEHNCSHMHPVDARRCQDRKLDNVGSGPILAMKLLKDGSVKGKTAGI